MSEKLSISELVSLKGKTALVTGAAMGIGRAITDRYAEAGAKLLLLDRDEAGLEETAKLARNAHGAEVETFIIDLADLDAVHAFWARVNDTPDIVMNNAGVFRAKEFLAADDDFVKSIMNVNYEAVRIMCKEFISRRGVKGGTIINVSSVEAKLPFKSTLAIYSVSKAAVSALTRSLAKEYSRDGFKINAIVPGGIMTPGFKNVGMTALKRLDFSVVGDAVNFSSRLPVGHYGEPDDIARVALYLASPMSDYLAGSEIVADGGFLSA